MTSRHPHPRPWLDIITQYGALAFIVLAILLVAVQLVFIFTGQPLLMLILTTVTLVFLLAPALWLTTATPEVEVEPGGLRLKPRIWPARLVAWQDIRQIKPYPLMPERDGERVRQAMVGRRKYTPAEGYMLLVPSLPWIYRFTGLFAGEGFTSVIALTNRTHSDYRTLIEAVRQHAEQVWS